MLAKKTSKNQITIPKDVVQEFPTVEYFDVYTKDGEIVLRPVQVEGKERLKRIRQKISSLGIKQQDIQDAIRAARQ
jgi:AbrB family looped-hinge helix DNA binding protein